MYDRVNTICEEKFNTERKATQHGEQLIEWQRKEINTDFKTKRKDGTEPRYLTLKTPHTQTDYMRKMERSTKHMKDEQRTKEKERRNKKLNANFNKEITRKMVPGQFESLANYDMISKQFDMERQALESLDNEMTTQTKRHN